MSSSQDLKRQIQSLDNTAKMTQALQTISAIKLRKAEERLKKARPYTDNIEEMMRDIAKRAGRARARSSSDGRKSTRLACAA